MAILANFPAEALAVPAADIRQLADLLTSVQAACGRAAALLIDRLDQHDGDSDLEDNGDLEPDDDAQGDVAYVEWHTKPANMRRRGQGEIIPTWNEDDEEDDDPGQCTEDEISTLMGLARGNGAGCKISDPGEDEGDREHEDI